jgi:hypothetical protein
VVVLLVEITRSTTPPSPRSFYENHFIEQAAHSCSTLCCVHSVVYILLDYCCMTALSLYFVD